MRARRALSAAVVALAIALAGCANSASEGGATTASQDTATSQRPATSAPAATMPPAAVTPPAIAAPATTSQPISDPPTGGPQPPGRDGLACKVDADCTAKQHCKDTLCRCVHDKCIALRPAIDPVIDPAPVPPPEI